MLADEADGPPPFLAAEQIALLGMLAPGWTDLGEDLIRPTVLSRSLTAGIVTSLVGLVNGIAICRAGGIPLEIFKEHVDKAITLDTLLDTSYVETIDS